MSAGKRDGGSTESTPTSVLNTLRDALVEVAREKEYMPPDGLLQPEELRSRAVGLAKALLRRYMDELKSKGSAEGQVLRLFEYSLLTGFNDAYELLRSAPPTGAPDVQDLFTKDVPLTAVPEQVAFLMRKMPMATLLMNRFVDWMGANEGEAAAVKVGLPDMLIFASYWTYFAGVSRGFRILGKWQAASASGWKIVVDDEQ